MSQATTFRQSRDPIPQALQNEEGKFEILKKSHGLPEPVAVGLPAQLPMDPAAHGDAGLQSMDSLFLVAMFLKKRGGVCLNGLHCPHLLALLLASVLDRSFVATLLPVVLLPLVPLARRKWFAEFVALILPSIK